MASSPAVYEADDGSIDVSFSHPGASGSADSLFDALFDGDADAGADADPDADPDPDAAYVHEHERD